MILDLAGGIVGGIWLAILGEWLLIGIGILLMFISRQILSILIMLNLPIGVIAAYFLERKNPLGLLFGFISHLYTNILIVGTCIFAFIICARFHDGHIDFSFIPYLLWSWGMALGPWYFFLSKEPDNEFSTITLFSASVFYLLFLTSIFISPSLELIVIIIFGVVQLIVLPIFNMYILNQMKSY